MSGPARILVVDDEPQVLRGLSAALGAAGYAVSGAATAAEAVESAALAPPDAVILDLRLPDGSGVDVCRRLREWTQVPIVVVSAVDEETEKIAALDAGADDYVDQAVCGGRAARPGAGRDAPWRGAGRRPSGCRVRRASAWTSRCAR